MDNVFNKLKLEVAVKGLWGMMEEQISLYEVTSKMLKEYYEALIKNGFTESQALELVKAHGVEGAIIRRGDKE